ncbi:MAG: CsiV family protein [Woeseiaceae bacterium]|nr:CsiV family protein [Woeseiaceae bacterium]
MKALPTTALLLILASTGAAQIELPITEEPEADLRRYAVEVIIFSYAQDVSIGSEVFLPDVIEPPEPALEATDDVALDEPEPVEPDEDLPLIRELELVLLGEDELTMTEIHGRMERLEVYEPLMHFGWVQPTYPLDETPAVKLEAFAEPPAGLNGELTLYLGRYLHLVVELALDDPNGPPIRETGDSFGGGFVFGDRQVEPSTGLVRFRISEDRIIKNGETRYFDHPRFGVLARVTRIEDEDAENPPEVDAGLVGRRFQQLVQEPAGLTAIAERLSRRYLV